MNKKDVKLVQEVMACNLDCIESLGRIVQQIRKRINSDSFEFLPPENSPEAVLVPLHTMLSSRLKSMQNRVTMTRLVVYVKGINNDITPEEIKNLIESHRHLSATVGEMKTCDIGEWQDHHPLNYKGADYEEWFQSDFPLGRWDARDLSKDEK